MKGLIDISVLYYVSLHITCKHRWCSGRSTVNGYSMEEDIAANVGSSSFCKSRDSEMATATFFETGGCRISETCTSC